MTTLTHKAIHDVKKSALLFFFLAFVARQSLQLLLLFFLLSLACRHFIWGVGKGGWWFNGTRNGKAEKE